MTAMLHREDDLTKWVGVRPGHLGTQVTKYTPGSTGLPVILHTVTQGKWLYLSFAMLSASTWDVGGSADMYVRDTNDNVVYYFCAFNLLGIQSIFAPMKFDPPVEIPPGYDIIVTKGSATSWVYGFIHGWEQ